MLRRAFALGTAGAAAVGMLVAAVPGTAQTPPIDPPQPTATNTEALTGATSAVTLQEDQRLSQPATTLLQDQRSGRRATPFGSDLFTTTGPTGTSGVLDPNYVIKPGDRVSVTMWGLVNNSQELAVDPNGNIVVPGAGPVHVSDLPASMVDAKVKEAVTEVYRNTVQVYAAPVSATTVQVFVTGAVRRPGAYAGGGSDSVVTFLQRAGGPDPDRGSFRNIEIKRDGNTVAVADLYTFLLTGTLPDVRLRGGDVIVVGPQGPIVSVTGEARAPYSFEFTATTSTGAELLRAARPRPEVTHVSVLGTRNGKPENHYLTIAEFASLPLMDSDRVRFETDAKSDTFVIRVEGANNSQSSYTVPRGTTLGSILSKIEFDPYADRSVVHLRRTSVAQTQKELLNESLARLEKAIYTTPNPTPSVATSRAVDTGGLETFIERARQVVPQGVVALPAGADANSVLLEPDDVIVIPYQSQVVVVGGEVNLPQSLIFSSGHNADDYVMMAGGFTPRSNRGQVLVIRQDGSAHIGGAVLPGDRVLVPPKVASSTFELVRDVTTILYQIGIAAAAVL